MTKHKIPETLNRSGAPKRICVPRVKFKLKTPPIEEALNEFINLLQFRETGAYLIAPQRWGKTYAAKYLCRAMQSLVGPISWRIIPMRKMKPGAHSFFGFLLTQLQYRYHWKKRMTEGEVRNLVTNCIASRGRASDLRLFVLVFDEAQLLTTEHWVYIFNIANEVDAFEVDLVVLTVGQMSLMNTKKDLLLDEREEITERFLQREIPFRGLQSPRELAVVLNRAQDAPIDKNSALGYVDLFLPRAAAAGWRLSSVADALWAAFVAVYEEAGLSTVDLPMTYVMSTVRRLLVALSHVDSESINVPSDMLRSSVVSSGINASIRSAKQRSAPSQDRT